MASGPAGTAVMQPPVLTVVNPSGQKTRTVLTATPFLIGRQGDNDLVLRDNRVSRVHARITRDGEAYYLEDLNSRHGLFVNGSRIAAKHKLLNSDTVGFGFPDSYQLIFSQAEREIGKLVDQIDATTKAASPAAANLAKLRALVEVARALQSSMSITEVLESVVDAALTVTGNERGFLLLKAGADLHVEVARDAEGNRLEADDLRVPMTVIQRALQSRRELLSMNFDPTVEGGINPEGSVANLELRSVVCIPLVRIKTEISTQTIVSPISETVGLIYLDSRLSVADLSPGNREILQTLALEASTVLENARLLEQERAKQALEQELKIARTIQQGLLPRSLPTTGWFRVSGSSISSQQVGGDYYDAAEITADNWRLIVADVSGKGVSSALLASLLQGAFLVGASTAAGIEAVLSRVNQYLFERTEGEKYATVFYLSAHRDGAMHWANAGHCAPIVLHRDGSMEHLRPTSMPVGMLDIAQFRAVDAALKPGDRVVVFSDGVTEAENTAGQFFEERRLLAVLQNCAQASAAQIHEKLTEALRDWGAGVSQRDDMTLVVAEYNP